VARHLHDARRMTAPVISRLVGIVPTYREGPLAASAINSILPHVDNVVVFDGPVGGGTDAGYETNLREFRKNPRVIIRHGEWKTEAAKRNAMLEYTRRMPTPCWAVYLDADEIFIGAEYVRDLIWAAHVNAPEGQEPTAIPIHITEVDSSVGRIHRLIRMDRLERHVLSMSQLKFFDQETLAVFPVIPVWRPGEPVTEHARPPMQGEPHIHHRSYYRPIDRGKFRLHAQEVDDFNDELLKLGIRPDVPGSMPVHQDPGFIVATEQDAPPQPPADPFGILGGNEQ
jgi:glycosyltransferase involved in cell wall biosynthesis